MPPAEPGSPPKNRWPARVRRPPETDLPTRQPAGWAATTTPRMVEEGLGKIGASRAAILVRPR